MNMESLRDPFVSEIYDEDGNVAGGKFKYFKRMY